MNDVHVPPGDKPHRAPTSEAQPGGDIPRARRRQAQDEALRAYAPGTAGTENDFDPQWAETALESLDLLDTR